MPVERRWYAFTRENVEKLPKNKIGAYILADNNKAMLRTGSSGSWNVGIRGRLISHIIHKTCPTAKYFKFAYADSAKEARDMETDAFNKYLRKNPKMLVHNKRIPRKKDDFLQLP
ncbi:MAG: hypothetical protein WC169_03400 [Dehalococcoidia bacterium]|jgi:hypothetical protein